MKPLCIDLYAGLGGWSEGFLAEGFRCVGFDIERHDYGSGGYPGELVLQDALSIHGSQFRDAACIVASPPCQEYSYMAMPWSRAKAIAAEYRSGVRDVKKLTALFDACFRIQREACEASGRRIPMVVENVRGAQPWVGRARWNYGSFYLWGDVPAIMPATKSIKQKGSMTLGVERWCREGIAGQKNPGFNFHQHESGGKGGSFQSAAVKTCGLVNIRDGHTHTRHLTNQREHDAVKQPGIRENGRGDRWFQDGAAKHGSQPNSRKAASAQIAKIPLALSRHIARCFQPIPLAPELECPKR